MFRNNQLLLKIIVSVACIAAVAFLLLRGDEAPVYTADGGADVQSNTHDDFIFDPEELTYDGSGELDLLEGVSLPGYSKQELKDLVYVEIETQSALSEKRVEYTADTEKGRCRSYRTLHLSGYTGPKITMPQNIPQVTKEQMDEFGQLLRDEDDFFVDDGFGNDTSDHMEVSAERDATDSSIVHYTVSIENVFGDWDLIVQDVVLSGCYPVLALVAQEVTLRVGQTFDPLSYVARAEREEGISAMKEVAVNGKVDTTRAGEYDLTYTLGGEAVSLHIIVE